MSDKKLQHINLKKNNISDQGMGQYDNFLLSLLSSPK